MNTSITILTSREALILEAFQRNLIDLVPTAGTTQRVGLVVLANVATLAKLATMGLIAEIASENRNHRIPAYHARGIYTYRNYELTDMGRKLLAQSIVLTSFELVGLKAAPNVGNS